MATVTETKTKCPASPNPDGAHYWKIDAKNHGVCKYCGAAKDFPQVPWYSRNEPALFITPAQVKKEAKEVREKMNSTGTLIETSAPPVIVGDEPDRKKDFDAWLEFHSTEIAADYWRMGIHEWRKKWGFNSYLDKVVREKLGLHKLKPRKERKPHVAVKVEKDEPLTIEPQPEDFISQQPQVGAPLFNPAIKRIETFINLPGGAGSVSVVFENKETIGQKLSDKDRAWLSSFFNLILTG